jgi:MYXO-CTERM domain-containing protein
MRFLVVVPIAALLVVGCSSSPENVGHSNDAVDYICSETASATLDGIPAYAYCGNFNVWSNNGADTKSSSGGTGWVQTEGGYGYQCVEYAARYEHFKFGIAAGWGISYAYQMCNTHPSGIATATTPVHGDLMIFAQGSCGADATAGHVAVVDVVNATTVKVVQENVAGSYTYNRSCASCWLHAASNNPTNDPCSSAPSNGLYCGQSTQFGGGTKDVLYDCQNGATSSKTTCQYGCIVEPPNTNDQCAPAPADAGASDASTKDAATDAAPKSDSGATQDAAPPQEDAGTNGGGTGGCSSSGTSPSRGSAWFGIALAALALIRARRAR